MWLDSRSRAWATEEDNFNGPSYGNPAAARREGATPLLYLRRVGGLVYGHRRDADGSGPTGLGMGPPLAVGQRDGYAVVGPGRLELGGKWVGW
jgi:hypothetical protein